MISVTECPQPSCRLIRSSESDELYCVDHHGTILIVKPMGIPKKPIMEARTPSKPVDQADKRRRI